MCINWISEYFSKQLCKKNTKGKQSKEDAIFPSTGWKEEVKLAEVQHIQVSVDNKTSAKLHVNTQNSIKQKSI